jgi:hypothetical protein
MVENETAPTPVYALRNRDRDILIETKSHKKKFLDKYASAFLDEK